MAAGATGSPAEQAAAEGPFMAALGKLFAVAEAYPDLKANQNFLALQTELSNTEDRLQTARRFYNANVREFNTRMQAFPSSVIAGHVPLRARGVLRDPGRDPGGRPAAGRLLDTGRRDRGPPPAPRRASEVSETPPAPPAPPAG